MTDRIYRPRVWQLLDALSPAERAAAERQLPFALDADDEFAVVADAYIFAADLVQPTADRISQKIRDRQMRDRRNLCWGRGAQEFDQASLGMAVQHIDPAALHELAQEFDQAAGCWSALADALVLDVCAAATRSHRSLRSVQTKMRQRCRSEAGGQLVLPGVPAAREVYSARALGGAA